MRIYAYCLAAVAVAAVSVPVLSRRAGPEVSAPAVVHAAAEDPVPPAPACLFPSVTAASPEETVWELFTAANCPWKAGNGTTLSVWESWPTQEEVYSSGVLKTSRNASASRFHGSFQQRALSAKQVSATGLTGPNIGCRAAAAPPHRTICEEVRLNPAAAAYVTSNGLTTHSGQATFVQKGKTFGFPPDAVEVKADWLPGCSDPKLHVETVEGKSYCLLAMHINSKLVPTWVWGTWEAKSETGTPNRCVTLGCSDAFGSLPATIPPGPEAKVVRLVARQTDSLKALETSRGLKPEWSHYALDGAQTSFGTVGQPVLLGNSITEEEIGNLSLTSSSCMTCHAYSAVNASGLDSIATLGAPVGPPAKLPAGYVPRDFVWSFLTAPAVSAPTAKK